MSNLVSPMSETAIHNCQRLLFTIVRDFYFTIVEGEREREGRRHDHGLPNTTIRSESDQICALMALLNFFGKEEKKDLCS